MNICAVIMAGGSGTRLWPLSRAMFPKQFLPFQGDETMLKTTFKRLKGLNIESSITICNEEHRFLVADQLSEIDQLGSIILEPVGRNTAPAIALAAMIVKDDPILLVLPADHVIKDENAFNKTILEALPIAEEGKLVTLGILPTKAEAGYGYIKRGIKKGAGFEVSQFVEKPSEETAQTFITSGDYYWNSGIFLFKASSYLKELKKYRNDIYQSCYLSVAEIKKELGFLRVDKNSFTECASESIDYAVMEKTTEAVVVPMDAGWNDLGSWSLIWDISSKDEKGNVTKGDVMLHDVTNSLVQSSDYFLTAVGVDNLVIVSTKDAIMVAHKDRVQEIKLITEQLKEKSRTEWEFHREVFRPWGKYDSIDKGERYQVKRITVKPGAKLSVQKHKHRAEHWVVVSGKALVTKGEETFILSENESTYIPVGVIHSLENPEETELEIIEVQSGSYLGEDDIVRLEDIYGR